MGKGNTRYVREIVLNQPGDLVQNVINDWLARNGYKQTNQNGYVIFQAGDGIITAKDYLVIGYTNGVFHIESWIKIYGKEVSVGDTSFAGIAVKKGIKQRVDGLLDYLSSQSYVESVTSNVYTQPQNVSGNATTSYNYTETINVKSYQNSKAATAPLIVGIVILCLDLLLIFLSFIPGWLLILGSVYGIVAACRALKLTHNSGKAIAALVINIVATVFSIGLIILNIIGAVLLAI